MHRNGTNLFLLILLLVSLTACNLPINQSADIPTGTSTPIAQLLIQKSPTPDLPLTITAQARLLESSTPDLALTITALAAELNSPTPNPASTDTGQALTREATSSLTAVFETGIPESIQTQESTPTPSTTTVTVSQNTNCRKGPGTQYDVNDALLTGQTAEVVGKNSASNYWIIKVPGNPSKTCWLWGQYATVSGNIGALAEVTPPPTPIPLPPAAPSNLSENNTCVINPNPGGFTYITSGTITWKDNSTNEKGYNIYWKVGFSGTVDVLLGSVGQNQTSYVFGAQQTYSDMVNLVKVEAFNDAGVSKRASVNIALQCP